jgi:hypothetical protein
MPALADDMNIGGQPMTKTIIFACAAPLFLISTTCTRKSPPLAPQAATAQPMLDGHPVIVRLVSRNQTLTITKGENGPVYSVHSAKGQPLLSLASREELRLRHPDLSHMLDSAIATTAQPAGASHEMRLPAAPADFTLPKLNADGPLMLHGE